MSDLLEVVFEGVPPSSVAPLVERLTGAGADVAPVDAVPPLEDSDDPPVRRVERWVDAGAPGWVVLTVATLEVGTVTIPQPQVRVLRYDEGLDVECNFTLEDLTVDDGESFVRALQAFAADLAGAHGVSAYFAGLEPAADEDTRLFTGSQLGPLSAAHLGA